MPFEDRQRQFGKEMVEITSPEMARDMTKNLSLRKRMSPTERDDLRRLADKIEQDWKEGRV